MTEPTQMFLFTIPGHRIIAERVDPHQFDGDETFESASYILTEYDGDDVSERYGYDNPVEAFEMFLEMVLTWVEVAPTVSLDTREPGQLCVFDVPEYRIVAECVGPDHSEDDGVVVYAVNEYPEGHDADRYVFANDPTTMYELFLNQVEEQVAAEKAGIDTRRDVSMITTMGAML